MKTVQHLSITGLQQTGPAEFFEVEHELQLTLVAAQAVATFPQADQKRIAAVAPLAPVYELDGAPKKLRFNPPEKCATYAQSGFRVAAQAANGLLLQVDGCWLEPCLRRE